MPDILDESPVPLSVARTYLTGRGGKHPDVETLRLWVTAGVSTPAGVVKLEAAFVAGTWQTSRAAVQRFTAARTEARNPGPKERAQTPGQQDRDGKRAGRELRRRWGMAV